MTRKLYKYMRLQFLLDTAVQGCLKIPFLNSFGVGVSENFIFYFLEGLQSNVLRAKMPSGGKSLLLTPPPPPGHLC
jgi:hypothetical protein